MFITVAQIGEIILGDMKRRSKLDSFYLNKPCPWSRFIVTSNKKISADPEALFSVKHCKYTCSIKNKQDWHFQLIR